VVREAKFFAIEFSGNPRCGVDRCCKFALWRAAFSHLRKNARHGPAELVELRASARKYVAVNHDTRRPGQQLRS
jgi:hypothetical protein